ncbi:hypothetical protein AA0119_g12105 [Alternaria tenuissima]|uniref:Uncharacterized protein n=1 Tax=Alternaria tenuissima TaxID=119927 RepID=A0ABY0FUM6_9PLEO|nr:hypothetical protein AA0120_g12214 [Alternaria tenuissima]RYN88166.1 hypothetical protein AA0119_g12105 [Alternaria tenuissima]RYO05971.1 hypothetical protein AA0121_g12210 [Alternaria tenuissima]
MLAVVQLRLGGKAIHAPNAECATEVASTGCKNNMWSVQSDIPGGSGRRIVPAPNQEAHLATQCGCTSSSFIHS